MVAPAVTALALIFLVAIGGVGYYTYAASNALAQENANLNSQLAQLQHNATLMQNELALLRASRGIYPMILLRTWGGALASYGSKVGGLTYLRLTETGPNSGVEAALASSPGKGTV